MKYSIKHALLLETIGSEDPALYPKLAKVLINKDIAFVRQGLEAGETLQYIKDLEETVTDVEYITRRGDKYTCPHHKWCFKVSPEFFEVLKYRWHMDEDSPFRSPHMRAEYNSYVKDGLKQWCIIFKDFDNPTYI